MTNLVKHLTREPAPQAKTPLAKGLMLILKTSILETLAMFLVNFLEGKADVVDPHEPELNKAVILQLM